MINRKNIIEIVGLPNFENKTIFKDGTNADVIKTLFACVPLAIKQTKNIANQFKGVNDLQTLKNIHTFIRQNLNYRHDLKGYQQIKLPNRYLLESGDCKSKALFIASLLTNLGYKNGFVFANYNPLKGNIPSHVYNFVYLPNGKKVFIDGTYKKFNQQPKPNYSKEMIIQALSDNMSTIGKPKRQPLKNVAKKVVQAPKKAAQKAVKVTKKVAPKAAQAVKKVAKTVTKGAATVGAAPGRGAFLAIVSLNVRDYAKKLNNLPVSEKDKLYKRWENLGGRRSELQKAILKGSTKKRILDDNGGISEPVTATLATATPVIAALATFLEKTTKAAEKAKKAIEPGAKLVDKAKKTKVLQQVKKVADDNPKLKERLKSLGKTKGQQVLNKVVQKTTGGQSLPQTTAPEDTESETKTETFEKETTGSKSTFDYKKLALLGGGAFLAYKLFNK